MEGTCASASEAAGVTLNPGAGELACITYPVAGVSPSATVSYTYTPDGQMASMSDWLGNTFTFGYDADSNLTAVAYPASTGLSASFSYDNADDYLATTLSQASGTRLEDLWPTNADGLVSANQVSLNGSTPSGPSFAYDQQNRMIEGPSLSGTSYDAYSYDPASNLTSVASVTAGASTNPTVAFAHDPAGELCYSYEASLPSGTSAPACGEAPPAGATDYTTYAYNADGERTMTKAPSGTTSYSWNALGELTGIATPGSSGPTTYAYDGAGLRMSATTGTSTTQFTWDQSRATPRILMDGENAYLYGPSFPGARGAPLEQISLGAPSSTSSASYLFSDPSGVRATISATGEVTSGMSYDAYGNPCGGCHLDTPFGFAGGYEDPTGLVYLVNRYYDPATAQFLSVDPLVGITGQPYAYAGDDPVNNSDPLGLSVWNPCSWGNVCHHVHNVAYGVVRFVGKHKAAIAEIVGGIIVVAGVVIASVATGGLIDIVGAAGAAAASEVADAVAGGAAVGLFGLTFPIDATISMLPFAGVGLIGVALIVYGGYQLYEQLFGASRAASDGCLA